MINHHFQGLDFWVQFSEGYRRSHFSMTYWLYMYMALVTAHNNEITGNIFLTSYKNILFGFCEFAKKESKIIAFTQILSKYQDPL